VCSEQKKSACAELLIGEKMKQLEFLSDEFLAAMNDIGRYGYEKYGSESFQARRKTGSELRGKMKRNQPAVIADHAREHFNGNYVVNSPGNVNSGNTAPREK
jgi:hypothetical protein